MVAAATSQLHRSHYENFPVASFLLPAEMRPHVAAVYAFARTADDFADEGALAADARLALLDGWSERLHEAAHGRPPRAAIRAGEPQDTPQLFARLGETMRQKAIPVELFDALLSAFRQDVTVHHYETWEHLADYCRRSADPVGRLVLRIAGHHDSKMDEWSDAICSALQLTNFWQDLRIDVARGRVYVPVEAMRMHGADERGLDGPRMDAPWRAVMADAVRRTRRLFAAGRPLCDAVSGRLRLELRATWLGGSRILDRIERNECDALVARPVLRKTDLPWFLTRLVLWGVGSGRE